MSDKDFFENADFREDEEDIGRAKRFGAKGIALSALALLLLGIGVGAYAVKGLKPLPKGAYAERNDAAMVELAPEPTQEPTPDALPADASPADDMPTDDTPAGDAAQYVKTALVVDGVTVGVLSSEEAARELIDSITDHFAAALPADAYSDTNVQNVLEFVPAEADAQAKNADELFLALTAEDTPLRVVSIVSVQTSTIVQPDYRAEDDKYLVKGTRVVESLGREGEKREVTTYEYINGVQQGEGETATVLLTEPVDFVVRNGTQEITKDKEPNKKQGKDGRDAGELVFKKPVAGDVILNFGQVNGVMHLGLDYKAKEGAEVKASCGGTVVSLMERGGYGLVMEIDHGDGFVTRYAHLDEASAGIGDTVLAGDVIGIAGTSGNTDGETLLHFELRIDGEAYNPRFYLA